MRRGTNLLTPSWLEITLNKVKDRAPVVFGGWDTAVGVTYRNFYNKNADAAMDDQLTYLTADTSLSIASTSGADVGQVMTVFGMDENYESKIVTGVTNGQNAVVLSAPLYRVFRAVLIHPTLSNAGRIYIYESSDTLTAGVPDTSSKIKLAMPIGYNSADFGGITVPKDGKIAFRMHRITSPSAKTLTLRIRTRLTGTSEWMTNVEFPIEGEAVELNYNYSSALTEGMDFEILVKLSVASGIVTSGLDGIVAYE